MQRQTGILRTNCIDCLDRTNVAQFAAGLSGLGRQLVGLGLAARPDLDPRSSAATQLMAMYESMGNTLARQVNFLCSDAQAPSQGSSDDICRGWA